MPTFASAGFKLFGAAGIASVSWSPTFPDGAAALAASLVVGATVVGAGDAASAGFAVVAVVGEGLRVVAVFVAAFFGAFFVAAGAIPDTETIIVIASSVDATPRLRLDVVRLDVVRLDVLRLDMVRRDAVDKVFLLNGWLGVDLFVVVVAVDFWLSVVCEAGRFSWSLTAYV